MTWVVNVDRGVYDADDGALLMQVKALASTGEWWTADPGAHLDPAGDFRRIAHAKVRDGEILPFPVRPAYVLAATEAWSVGGVRAATLLGVSGVCLAAGSCWVITRELDVRAAPVAFWLVGLGSPLTFQGLALQGHGFAAGFVAFGVHLALRHRAAPVHRLLLAGAACSAAFAAAALVRRETVVFAMALGVGSLVCSLRGRDWRILVLTASAGAGALAGVLLDRVIVTQVVGIDARSLPTGSRFGFLTDRIYSAARFILAGYREDPHIARVLALGAVLTLLGGIVLYRRHGSERDFLCVLAAVVAILVVRLVVSPTPFIPGFLPAFPIAVLIIGLAGRSNRHSELMPLLVVTFWTTVLLTTLTQYPAGGGFEWGGRYLSFAVLALAPVGAVAIVDVHASLSPGRIRSTGAGLLVALALIPSTMGLLAQRNARSTNAANVEAGYALAERLGVHSVVSTDPELPRVNDRHLEAGVPWFYIPYESLDDFLPLLERRGITALPVFSRQGARTAANLDGTGWSLRDAQTRPENPGTVVLAVLERDMGS